MASLVQSFTDRVMFDGSPAQPGLTLKKDELAQAGVTCGQVTASSGLPCLTSVQRERIATVQLANPAGALFKLATAMRKDAAAPAALGISADQVQQVAAQTAAVFGYTAQAQKTVGAARAQGSVVVERIEAQCEALWQYRERVKAEPAAARPAGEQINILGALETPCSLLERIQVMDSERRRDVARALAPLKESLALSAESLAELQEINRLLTEVRDAP